MDESGNVAGKSAARVAVIGGGIAGLTVAYRLAQRGEAGGRPLQPVLFESSDRLGGIIETERRDGLILERGPDSFITDKPWARELCEELGHGGDLISTRTENRGSFVVRDGELCPVPDGLHLMAPARIAPFVASPILSWPGKLRALMDLVVPARTDGVDESLADFVRRRLGNEVLERVAQPMIGGIYTSDPEKLSLAATMPRFIDMERSSGSVIRALMRARKRAAQSAQGPRYDLFMTPARGVQSMVEWLEAALPAGVVRKSTAITKLARNTDGTWTLATTGGETEIFDAVCVCTPSHAAAKLLEAIDAKLAAELSSIEHASSATVNLIYRRDAIAHALNGFGFVVPAVERRDVIACSFSSIKFAGRAPEDKVLLRAFVGGALAPEKFEWDDARVLDAVKRDLGALIGATGEPEMSLVSRWPHSMPQYHVGHLARVERIEARTAACPGLEIAGNAYGGTGIPDCVKGANDAAERVAAGIAERAAG